MATGATSSVRIKGQAELNRAFLELRREVFLELKAELVKAGEAVRVEAEHRAGAEISNIGPQWERMRLGVTVKGVYIAPRSKNRGGSPRPSLAPMLMGAMEEALEAKKTEIEAEVEALITASAARNRFF